MKTNIEAITNFMNRCAGKVGNARFALLQNPTEEIEHAQKNKKSIRLFNRAGSGGARARLEENYLFDTRRVPGDTTNVIGAGAITAGEYIFFQSAVGAPGVNNGFATGFNMSEAETNMDQPGQVSSGKNFVINQIGISFNAEAKANDIAQVMDAGSLKYEKQGGQTTLKHGKIAFWPGAGGVGGFAALDGAAAAVSTEQAQSGLGSITNSRKLVIPRVIRENENFSYKYIVPRSTRAKDGVPFALTDFVLMTVWLWGGQQDNIPV